MVVSMFIPPSVFYTQLLPNAKTNYELNRLYISVSYLLGYVTNVVDMFRYDKRNKIINQGYYRQMAEEKIHLTRYLSEIEEKLTMLQKL